MQLYHHHHLISPPGLKGQCFSIVQHSFYLIVAPWWVFRYVCVSAIHVRSDCTHNSFLAKIAAMGGKENVSLCRSAEWVRSVSEDCNWSRARLLNWWGRGLGFAWLNRLNWLKHLMHDRTTTCMARSEKRKQSKTYLNQSSFLPSPICADWQKSIFFTRKTMRAKDKTKIIGLIESLNGTILPVVTLWMY